jgi:ABC-type transporter Mla subunit MlaD
MAVGTNYWKIGLFVVIGAGALVALLLVVGARNWSKETVQYVTYFDESVQGLERGAPVKFRGVTIGTVEVIGMAPDRRLVDVRMELDESSVGILQSAVNADGGASVARTQLAQAGLTGQRFVLVDVFDAKRYPEQALPFPAPERYLSSVPSTLVQIENAVVQTSDQLPIIAERAVQALSKIEGTLASIDAAGLPDKMSEGVGDARKTLALVNSEVAEADIPETSKELRVTLSAMTKTLNSIDATLQRINARDGVLSSIEGSMSSVQRVASGAQSVAPQIDTTLKEVQAAARSFRRLTDALEREPDMLIKGRVGSLP